MDVDTHALAILLHCLPVFCNFGLRTGQLSPCYRLTLVRQRNHLDTGLDRTDVETQPASDAVSFTDHRLRTRGYRLFAAIRGGSPALRLHDNSRGSYQVDTLMRGIVTRHIAKIALNAFLRVDACDGTECKIEVPEIRDT